MGGEYVWVDRAKLFHCLNILVSLIVWIDRPKPLHCLNILVRFIVWVDRPKLLHSQSSNVCCFLHVQDFKYQMINKFSSIDNASHKQKKYNELRGEIYLITASDSVWTKWKSVFDKHKMGDLINL